MKQGPTTDAPYLGGSQIAAVAGLDPYSNALKVWGQIKNGLEVPTTIAMDLGNAVERPALAVYAKHYGVELSYPGTILVPGGVSRDPRLWRGDTPTWRGATPDAIEDRTRPAQFKKIGTHSRRYWGGPDEGPDGVPPWVLAQNTWEAMALEADRPFSEDQEVDHLRVVGEYGNELFVYAPEFDREFLAGLEAIGWDFWRRYILGDEVPDVTEGDLDRNRDILFQAWPKAEDMALLPINQTVEDLARRYAWTREQLSIHEKAKKALRNQLIAEAKEVPGFVAIDGAVKVTYKNRADGPRVLDVRVKD